MESTYFCTVCSSTKGTSLYYGGLVCGGCKVFFLRTIRNGYEYKCKAQGKCKIKDSFIKCRACRFALCLKSNMNPDAVGISREAKFIAKDELPDLLDDYPTDKIEIVFLKKIGLDFVIPACCSYSPPNEVPLIEEIDEKPFLHRPSRNPRKRNWKDRGVWEFDKRRAVVPYLNKGFKRHTEILSTSYLIGKGFIDELKRSGFSAKLMAKRLTQLESVCNLENSMAPIKPRFNLDVSLEKAILDPLILCSRTPMGWCDGEAVSGGLLKIISVIYTRMALHYLDWVSGLHEIQELDEKDKFSLISSQLCQIELSTMVYNTYKEGKKGILFASGFHYLPPKEKPKDEFDLFIMALSDYMHSEVISKFEELQINVEEYALMKIIGFYTPTVLLSDKSTTLVQRTRFKYEQLLKEYIRETYPNLSKEDQQMRIYKIVAINRNLLHLGIMDNSYITKMFSLNMANLQKRFTYDMHLKRY